MNKNLDHNHQTFSALDGARSEAWVEGGCGSVFCTAKFAGLDHQTWEAEAMNCKPQSGLKWRQKTMFKKRCKNNKHSRRDIKTKTMNGYAPSLKKNYLSSLFPLISCKKQTYKLSLFYSTLPTVKRCDLSYTLRRLAVDNGNCQKTIKSVVSIFFGS